MNFKTTLILLLLLVGVGSYLLFVSLKNPMTTGKGWIQLFPKQTFSPNQVSQIAVKRQNDSVKLQKKGRHWHQIEPVSFPLNDYAASKGILAAISEIGVTESVTPNDSNQSLASFQLDPPIATLTLGQDDQEQHTLFLGEQLSNGTAYLMVQGQSQVHIVTDELHKAILSRPTLDKTAELWRQMKLKAPHPGATNQIKLTYKNQTAQLLKKKSQWELVGNNPGRANTPKIQHILMSLQPLTIKPDSFIDAPKNMAAYGLETPLVVLQIHATDTSPQSKSEGKRAIETVTLRIGSPNPNPLTAAFHYATWSRGSDKSNVVFQIATNPHVISLAQSVNNLRDPRVTPLRLADIKGYTLRRGNADPVKLHKTANGWIFAQTDLGFKPDQNASAKLLEQIMRAGATHYITDPKWPKQSKLDIELVSIGADQLEVLSVFDLTDPSADLLKQLKDPPDKYVMTRRHGESIAYVFKRSALWRIFEPNSFLRDRTVLSLEPDTVETISLAQSDGVKLNFTSKPVENAPPPDKNAKPQWRLEGQRLFEFEAFEVLRNNLFNLRAERWLTDQAPVNPAITVTLTTNKEKVFQIDVDPVTGHAIANIDGPRRFSLPKPLIEILGEEFRWRTISLIGPGQLIRVRQLRGGKSRTIQRNRRGEFKSIDGEVIETFAAGLFDTLSSLRVKRYVEAPKKLPAIHTHFTGVTASSNSFDLDAYKLEDDTYLFHFSGKRGDISTDRWFTLDEATREKLLG